MIMRSASRCLLEPFVEYSLVIKVAGQTQKVCLAGSRSDVLLSKQTINNPYTPYSLASTVTLVRKIRIANFPITLPKAHLQYFLFKN